MTAPTPPSTPPQGKPGYYPDSSGVLRWWTGHGWTDHIMGQPAPPQPVHPPKRTRGALKWIPLGLLLAVASCGALIAVGGSDSDTPTTTSATATADEPDPTDSGTSSTSSKSKSKRATKPKTSPAATTVKDGDYLVGREIAIGTWKARKVPHRAISLCYADTENKKGDILEQEVGSEGESVIIRIRRNAYTFTSSGCGTWKKID